MGKEPRKKEHYEVLYEDIKKMVQLVLEGHSTLDEKIESLRGEVRGAREELGDVGKAVTESRQRLDTLINRFEAYEHAHTN